MSSVVALPMYVINPPDVDALWQTLSSLLARRDIETPKQLSWPDDLPRHWQDTQLLLSQTCGWPLVATLPEVQVVGCFHYSAAGCDAFGYRSFLVTRRKEPGQMLADFAGRVAVCNSADSQSGYHSLRRLTGSPETFFSQVNFSGSHVNSLQSLRNGDADIAAIDCVTWALIQRHQPGWLAGLTAIGDTPLTPGLPLITSPSTPPETLQALRDALKQLVREHKDVCKALLIHDFTPVPRQAWDMLLHPPQKTSPAP